MNLGFFEWRDEMRTYLETQKGKENIHSERLAWCDLYRNCGGAKIKMLVDVRKKSVCAENILCDRGYI